MADLIINNGTVYVPEEGVTLDFTVTEDKPYNKCFECRAFRARCSGPNPLSMEFLRACEFLQMTRVFLGWSYQRVASETERIGMPLSLTTVKRTLIGKNPDPSFYTMSALNIALIGVPDGTKYPCAYPDVETQEELDKRLDEALRELERSLADNKEYQGIISGIHKSYKAELAALREDSLRKAKLEREEAQRAAEAIRAEAQKKIDYLLAACDRLRIDRDSWRAESNRWQAENERKGKLIDKHLDKMLGT